MLRNGATHGIQWADFDGNGALGIAMCNNNPNGHHYLWRNLLPPERAGRSLQVMVLDKNGHATKPGSEVRIWWCPNLLLGALLILGVISSWPTLTKFHCCGRIGIKEFAAVDTPRIIPIPDPPVIHQ